LVISAGVGRTGVFIALSIVLERMRYEGVVDIFQTVKMLRTQRPAMVQTEVSRHDDIGVMTTARRA
jgi:netrin-G3 ligand